MNKTVGERDQIFQIIIFSATFLLFLIGIAFLLLFHQDSFYPAMIIGFSLLFCVFSLLISYYIGNLKIIRKAITSRSYQTGDIVDVRVFRYYFIRVVLGDGREITAPSIFFGKYRNDFRKYQATICFRRNRPILVDVLPKQK